MIGMDGPNLKDQRALERILHYEKVTHRKIRFAKVKAVNGNKADVELIDQDKFLNKEGKGEIQQVKLTGLPIRGLSMGGLTVYFMPAVDDEVLVMCSDRSVQPHKDQASTTAQPVADVSLHGFNGAFIVPIEISAGAVPEGAAAGVLIVGTKDNSSRFEIHDDGLIDAKCNQINLGGSTHPVAKGDQTDTNIGIVATKVDALGTILGLPPLPPLTSTAMTKAKGA